MISLTVPYPPSANRMWRRSGAKIHKSTEYQNWLKQVGWLIKSKRVSAIEGPYNLALKIAPVRNQDGSASKRQRDLDNFIKPISDALQACGVIENDSFAQTIYMEWTSATDGCWIEVSEARVAA